MNYKNTEFQPYYEKLSKNIEWLHGKPFHRYKGKRKSLSKPAGCLNNDGYRLVSCTINDKNRTVSASRLRWFMEFGSLPELYIAHKDHDRDNNRIENLRALTITESLRSRRKIKKVGKKKTSSKYVGVHWYKQGKKWRAVISILNKKRHLGDREDEKEAALLYDQAVRDHGLVDVAIINFPQTEEV